jgi:hypothetical protein
MKSFLIVFAMVLISVCSAFAQLQFVNSTPGNGEVGVAQQMTLSFIFSEPLDTVIRWNTPEAPFAVFASDPQDSIGFSSVYYSNDNRTVSVDLQLTANTDYCWAITNARAANGDTLTAPFGLNFSTAPEGGTTMVMGAVYNGGASSIDALVALLAQPPSYEGRRDVRYGAVITSQFNNFGFVNVRNGTYWLVAALDVNRNGELDEDELQADYDINADGVGDSIVVAGTTLFGLQLSLAVSATPETPAALPQSVLLAQNYPNPFNPTTTIGFTLPDTRMAKLTVFDVLGREIAVLQNGLLSAGNHTVEFDAHTLAGGLYFYRLDAGDASRTHKMLLLK